MSKIDELIRQRDERQKQLAGSSEQSGQMSNNKVPIEDLAYELQLLLGSAKIVGKIEEYDQSQDTDKYKLGNLVNYFKDSAYLHARNLYNFFAANTKNDAKVTQYINTYLFDLSIYDKWSDGLHDHVLHIKTKRGVDAKTNVVDRAHLNEMVPTFAKDIRKLWQNWINNTPNEQLKKQLEGALEDADSASDNDVKRWLGRLK